MSLLYVHNDDIVNNTGIVLSNPTGDIGTYELKNDPGITETWYISGAPSGAPFTGSIVTVGSGKMFPTPRAAVDGTVGDVMFLVYTGTYIDPIFHSSGELNGRNLFFKSVDGYELTIFIGQEVNYSMQLAYHSNVTLMFEDISFQGDPLKYQQHVLYTRDCADINVYMNKCMVNLTQLYQVPTRIFWDGVLSTNYNVFISSCTIMGYLEPDHNTICFFGSSPTTRWDISGSSITRTLFPNIRPATMTVNTTESFAVSDYVFTPAVGYGVEYGDYIITSTPTISSSNISWGGGTPTEITEDGTYTLSDGSNTIDATIDYSELSTETTIDNVRVVLTVSGSIILQSLPNVQIVKVGTTQQYLLSIVSSGGIIEDYITSDVTWASSNENIATVSSNGLVYAVSLGNVTISATYRDITLSIGIKTTKDSRTQQMEPERLSPHPYTYTATLGVSSRTGVK